jgi:hypothetical protein
LAVTYAHVYTDSVSHHNTQSELDINYDLL